MRNLGCQATSSRPTRQYRRILVLLICTQADVRCVVRESFKGLLRSVKSSSDATIIPTTENSALIEIFLFTLTCDKSDIQFRRHDVSQPPFPDLADLGCDVWSSSVPSGISMRSIGWTTSTELLETKHSERPGQAFVWCSQAGNQDFAAKMVQSIQADITILHRWYDQVSYKGRAITSFEPGRWDAELMEEAGARARHRMKAA